MQKLHFLKIATALVFFVLPSMAYANLLSNPGFETWMLIPPQGEEVPSAWWHLFNFDPEVTGTKSSTVAKNGLYSGKMELIDYGWGEWEQRQPFMAGDTLYVHQPVYIPTDMTNAKAIVKITFENSPDVPVDYSVSGEKSTATIGWEPIQFNAVAPVGTNYFTYEILLEALDVYDVPFSGVAYVDDAYANTEPVPEPASFLLFSLGLGGILVIISKKEVVKA